MSSVPVCSTGLTQSPPECPSPLIPRDKQRTLKPLSFLNFVGDVFGAGVSQFSCLGFQPSPSALTLLPWRRQHKASLETQLPLFPCFSFSIRHQSWASHTDMSPWPPRSRWHKSYFPVLLFPEASRGMLWVSLTPGYNEGSDGSAPV